MFASILILTIDRYEITKKVFETNIARLNPIGSNIRYEILVCDNGSQDRNVVEYFKGKTEYHRLNSRNEGIGHSLNQLYLRAKGDVICCLGNDIEMPDDWLNSSKRLLQLPNIGIVGFDWGHGHTPPITEKHGIKAGWLNSQLNRVFGSWLMNRSLIEHMGFFHEGYGPYGIEDSDFNERVNRSGYDSCYHPGLKSRHLVQDVGQNSDYRKMKDASLTANAGIFGKRLQEWDAAGKDAQLIEPLPPLRDPI